MILKGNWTQKGADINGEAASDNSGHSVFLSRDGNTLAVGARYNNGKAYQSGHTRVFTFSEGNWEQKGADIDGELQQDFSGSSVSLSDDGNTLAVGAPGHDKGVGVSNSGQVRVFTFSEGNWEQKGADIDGKQAGESSGRSVSLSKDGNTLAIGAIASHGNGFNSGCARVFNFSEGKWQQKGVDIYGEAAGDQSGFSVSLAKDGDVVAVGAVRNNGNSGTSGHVRVFTFSDESWQQKGADIDGEANGDESGFSVSLANDGNVVAVGAVKNDGNGTNSGHTRVFTLGDESWQQKGGDIDGEAAHDQSGHSVALSDDGNVLVVGSYGNDDNGGSSGHARVFTLIDGGWQQKGGDIDGESSGDFSGYSVSISGDGNVVAVGAIGNDENGGSSGHTRIYEFPTYPLDEIDPIGDAQILSNLFDNSDQKFYFKVLHLINRNPKDVKVHLKKRRCEEATKPGEAIEITPQLYEYNSSSFSYNLTFDPRKTNTSELVKYDDNRKEAGKITFCTQINTSKSIEDKDFTIFSRKFDYSISFNLTGEISFETIDGSSTEVEQELEEFTVMAFVCSDENKCIPAIPVEPNSLIDICLEPSSLALEISNFAMSFKSNSFVHEYPVVQIGSSIWEIVEEDFTKVTKVLQNSLKISTIAIYDFFRPDLINKVTVGGNVILDFLEEKRSTSFSSFELNLVVANNEVDKGGCLGQFVHTTIQNFF